MGGRLHRIAHHVEGLMGDGDRDGEAGMAGAVRAERPGSFGL
jgi:hypothetical protein